MFIARIASRGIGDLAGHEQKSVGNHAMTSRLKIAIADLVAANDLLGHRAPFRLALGRPV